MNDTSSDGMPFAELSVLKNNVAEKNAASFRRRLVDF